MWNQWLVRLGYFGDRKRMFKLKIWATISCVFNFEDECDLDRVLKHEPWTYDKHLVVFEKVIANVPISSLTF